MNSPHFLLRSEASQPDQEAAGGSWRFVLHAAGGERFEAEDNEPLAQGERLELLAAVRGLESLDQPSRVILSTSSRFVYQGIVQGLEQWRANDWQWERFSELVPIKHRDLWQRMAQALAIHTVECRLRGRLLTRGCPEEVPAAVTPATEQTETPEVTPAPIPSRRAGPRRRWRLDSAHSGQSRSTSSVRAEWETPGYDTPAAAQESAGPLAAACDSVKELWHSLWGPARVELVS